MKVPAEFDEIRPYSPEELPAVFNELLADEQFMQVALSMLGGMPKEQFQAALLSCHTNLEVQKMFFYPLLQQLLAKCSAGCDMNADALADKNQQYTFISNHRDISISFCNH